MHKLTVLLLNDLQARVLYYALHQKIQTDNREVNYESGTDYTDEEWAAIINIHDYLRQSTDIPF